MPELPEVETVRLGLAPYLEGKRILKAKAFADKLRLPVPPDFQKCLVRMKVLHIRRRAKYLIIDLGGGTSVLLHLGMSGQILIRPAGREPFLPEKHEHFYFETSDGVRFVFRDPRKFGLVTFAETDLLSSHPLLQNLGPEPLGNEFSGPVLKDRLKGKTVSIKQALLDQRVVAGVGNIYASEALYRAGINPKRKAGSIGPERLERLAGGLREVLTDALASGGSSLRDFIQVNGDLGYFQHNFDVYERGGAPCRTPGCSGIVRRLVQGARSTFYCPRCQR